MSDVDKKQESITALKNANKHLTDLFSRVEEKDRTLGNVASELVRVSNKLGDICVDDWEGGRTVHKPLRLILQKLAGQLTEARS